MDLHNNFNLHFGLNALGDSVVINPAIVGIQPALNDKLVSVYPTPVTDHLKVRSPLEIRSVDIVNELGEVVFSEKVNQKSFDIQTASFRSGMYTLCLASPSGMIRKRITVMH